MKTGPLAVDLSHWETVTDFDAVHDAGIVGVIYKATEGADYVDSTYADAKERAQAAGLLWGAYHFLRPGDLRQQARFFLSTVGEDLDLYCADHEDPGVNINELKEFVIEILRRTGKHAVIYSGHVIKEQLGDECDDVLCRFRLWIAHYTEGEPEWPKGTWPEWWLWQYTENGTLPGIDDLCDLNYYNGEAYQLYRDWKSL